jgi:hypothetical protein
MQSLVQVYCMCLGVYSVINYTLLAPNTTNLVSLKNVVPICMSWQTCSRIPRPGNVTELVCSFLQFFQVNDIVSPETLEPFPSYLYKLRKMCEKYNFRNKQQWADTRKTFVKNSLFRVSSKFHLPPTSHSLLNRLYLSVFYFVSVANVNGMS